MQIMQGKDVAMAIRSHLLSSRNSSLCAALDLYDGIEADHMRALESTGVIFAPRDERREETRELLMLLNAGGARIRNGGASVAFGSMSPGCLACTGACVSRTYAISNACHRDCFFCFNPNQKGFAYYCEHSFPWSTQLDDLANECVDPMCIALSGGEPLISPNETCMFFERARELFPQCHLRMYTSGDLLNPDLAERLREAGLDEVRFSIKQDDPAGLQECVLSNMKHALDHIPRVMVEMPPIPGTDKQMHDLLQRFAEIGIHGVNLLELTYPMWNWSVFESLGLTLKNPPYKVFYDYLYAGSLAVEGSEELCLRLMLWACDQGIDLNMHYCSLENKHRAQLRNLSEPYAHFDRCYALDYDDFFIKTGMVFGPDRVPVRAALRARGCVDFLEDDGADSTSFHPKWLQVAARVRAGDGGYAQACISSNVVVDGSEGLVLRELKLELASGASPVRQIDRTKQADDAFGDTLS